MRVTTLAKRTREWREILRTSLAWIAWSMVRVGLAWWASLAVAGMTTARPNMKAKPTKKRARPKGLECTEHWGLLLCDEEKDSLVQWDGGTEFFLELLKVAEALKCFFEGGGFVIGL